MQRTSYLYPTSTGYKLVTRRIGKRSPKRPGVIERLFAPWLLLFTISLCAGMVIGKDLQHVETVEARVVSNESAVIDDVEMVGGTEAGHSQPSPIPTTETLTEKEQIIAYIYEVFGEHAEDAIKVVGECENKSWNPKAVNHNRNGTVDRGIFQLNSAYWGGEENFDWKTNVDKAYIVFERAGKKWTPWTCSHVVGQKNYLYE